MEIEKEFQKFYRLLKNNQADAFISEILNEVEMSDIIFSPPDNLKTSHVFRVYKDRYNIALHVTKADVIEGWEKTLEGIRNEPMERINIVTITTSIASYTVFISDSMDRIIGILKSINHDFAKAIELRRTYRGKNLPLSSRVFSKMTLLSDS